MRARLALIASGVPVALREILLRDKPAAFLEASQSGTVPCLVAGTEVIDESLDIMVWALRQNDPQGWLAMPKDGWDWIVRCDGPFKEALDRTKYASRYPDADPAEEREKAVVFLIDLEKQLDFSIFAAPSLADYAILPFVRQFAFIDKEWFDARPWPRLKTWLETFLASDAFAQIMPKYAQWQPGDPVLCFPPAAHLSDQTR